MCTEKLANLKCFIRSKCFDKMIYTPNRIKSLFLQTKRFFTKDSEVQKTFTLSLYVCMSKMSKQNVIFGISTDFGTMFLNCKKCAKSQERQIK